MLTKNESYWLLYESYEYHNYCPELRWYFKPINAADRGSMFSVVNEIGYI